jgi:hypothetical protein
VAAPFGLPSRRTLLSPRYRVFTTAEPRTAACRTAGRTAARRASSWAQSAAGDGSAADTRS